MKSFPALTVVALCLIVFLAACTPTQPQQAPSVPSVPEPSAPTPVSPTPVTPPETLAPVVNVTAPPAQTPSVENTTPPANQSVSPMPATGPSVYLGSGLYRDSNGNTYAVRSNGERYYTNVSPGTGIGTSTITVGSHRGAYIDAAGQSYYYTRDGVKQYITSSDTSAHSSTYTDGSIMFYYDEQGKKQYLQNAVVVTAITVHLATGANGGPYADAYGNIYYYSADGIQHPGALKTSSTTTDRTVYIDGSGQRYTVDANGARVYASNAASPYVYTGSDGAPYYYDADGVKHEGQPPASTMQFTFVDTSGRSYYYDASGSKRVGTYPYGSALYTDNTGSYYFTKDAQKEYYTLS